MSLIDKARESQVNSYFKLEEDYQLLVDHAQDLERQLKAHIGMLRHVQKHIDTLRDEELGEMGNQYCNALYESIEIHLDEGIE